MWPLRWEILDILICMKALATQQKGSMRYDSTVASLMKNINEEELVTNNDYESHALTAVPNNCYEEELVGNQSHTPTAVCHEEELVTNNAYESHTLMACSTYMKRSSLLTNHT